MILLPKMVNIVLLAKNHNPSIVTKDWLKQKGIIDDVKDFVSLPIFSMAKSEKIEIIVDQERMQMSLININSENIKSLPYHIADYIKSLPETPYKAVGFNFSYEIEPKRKLREILKTDSKIFDEAFSKDFSIGGIVFFNFKDFLSTVNIQPTKENKLVINFNYNFKSSDKKKINVKLDQHIETWVKSENILKVLFDV